MVRHWVQCESVIPATRQYWSANNIGSKSRICWSGKDSFNKTVRVCYNEEWIAEQWMMYAWLCGRAVIQRSPRGHLDWPARRTGHNKAWHGSIWSGAEENMCGSMYQSCAGEIMELNLSVQRWICYLIICYLLMFSWFSEYCLIKEFL